MKRLATYAFDGNNDTGIDKMPVGAQGVINQGGQLKRFVKGVEDDSLTPTTTVGQYMDTKLGDFYEDRLYPSNNYTQSPTDYINFRKSLDTVIDAANKASINLEYSSDYPLDIFINGELLSISKYMATNETSVSFTPELVVGSNISIKYVKKSYADALGTMIDVVKGNSIDIGIAVDVIQFNIDGTILVVSKYGTIRSYALTTAWDITTATLLGSKNISHMTRALFNNTGTEVIIAWNITTGNAPVYNTYSLTTAWDISTFTAAFSATSYETNRMGGFAPISMIDDSRVLFAKTTKVTYSNGIGANVYYGVVNLDSPNDFINTDLINSFQGSGISQHIAAGGISNTMIYPHGTMLTSDGTKFYAAASYGGGGQLNEYALTTPFDFSTLVYIKQIVVPSTNGVAPIPGGHKFVTCKNTTLVEYDKI